MIRRKEGQGDFFDPDAKLNAHCEEEHGGKMLPACARCRELSHEALESGEVYQYTGEGDCRFCHDPVLWFRTPDQSQMPVDRDRFFEAWPELGKVGALRGFWTTRTRGRRVVLAFNHWATCPNADQAREKGGAWYEEVPGPPEGKQP